ncbi:MAG: response regulator [Desulfotomaculaceae bacterium]|nr:response regulator [Desulfotomaculaceae bacterium]
MNNNYFLVVDDNFGIRRLIHEVLSVEGYNIKMAVNGADAINKARASIPALILLDIKMPVMNGLEMLRQLKELNINVPVVLMTAYYDIDKIKKAIEGVALNFINKPFDIDELLGLIKRVLADNQL